MTPPNFLKALIRLRRESREFIPRDSSRVRPCVVHTVTNASDAMAETTVEAVNPVGAVSACLRSAMCISDFMVSEAWLVSPGSVFTLVRLKSTAPLIADVNGEDVVVDLAIAREFSSRHTLAQRLCASVAATRRPQWASDVDDDELLPRLQVALSSAVAVPVLRSTPKPGAQRRTPGSEGNDSLLAILVFFSNKPVAVRIPNSAM